MKYLMISMSEMIKCPECGEPITELHQDVRTETTVYSLDSDGNYEAKDFISTYEEIGGFYCPECYEELAETREEAVELLNKSELEIRIEESLKGGE